MFFILRYIFSPLHAFLILNDDQILKANNPRTIAPKLYCDFLKSFKREVYKADFPMLNYFGSDSKFSGRNTSIQNSKLVADKKYLKQVSNDGRNS